MGINWPNYGSIFIEALVVFIESKLISRNGIGQEVLEGGLMVVQMGPLKQRIYICSGPSSQLLKYGDNVLISDRVTHSGLVHIYIYCSTGGNVLWDHFCSLSGDVKQIQSLKMNR